MLFFRVSFAHWMSNLVEWMLNAVILCWSSSQIANNKPTLTLAVCVFTMYDQCTIVKLKLLMLGFLTVFAFLFCIFFFILLLLFQSSVFWIVSFVGLIFVILIFRIGSQYSVFNSSWCYKYSVYTVIFHTWNEQMVLKIEKIDIILPFSFLRSPHFSFD